MLIATYNQRVGGAKQVIDAAVLDQLQGCMKLIEL